MIKVENLTVKFDSKVIFDGFNKEFEDNKIYAIMGRSGCGKSTLLKVIAGLLKSQNGQVLLDGKKIHRSMKEIFMMHQNYANFPWKTCLDNVLFPIKIQNKKVTEENEKEAIEMLKKVGLEGCENKFPYELSGGMNQRVALARVLMSKPQIMLMDEPLSALDPKTRSEMQNLILDLHYRTKNTIIMVTHDPDEARKLGNEIINL